VGIWLGITADCRVVENHVHHLPYTGISLGWSWNPHPTGAGGNHIVNNHIHDVLQTLSDGGGIYTLGNQPGTKLVGNRIYHVPLNAGRAESNGIFMDEGSSEILVQQNIIHEITRSPIRFHKALNNKIVDNQLAHADDVPMFKFNACQESAMRFENNRRLVNPGELPSP
jgi:hypothetical protein